MKEDGGKDLERVDRWSEALSWHATLREGDDKELTSSVGRQWQDWYADAENREVFDDLSRLLAGSDRYRKRRRPSGAELEEDSYDLSIPIAKWRRARAEKPTGKQRSFAGNWWWLSGGLGAVAITALFVMWSPRFQFGAGRARSIVYQTQLGALKDVQLSDGSSIILGGSTKVSVAFSPHRRSVTLIGGQAWFKVAHDPRRIFIVTAGDGTIRDLGTAFLVTRESDRVVVTVTEGAVEVSARPSMWHRLRFDEGLIARPALSPIRVSRGEELAFGDNGALSSITHTDTRAATTWTRGRLTFDNQPLRYVIEAVNRYSPRHIVVSPSAGALRFSGIVFSDEIEDWLQSLKLIFPVTVEEQGFSARIQMRSSTVAGERAAN